MKLRAISINNVRHFTSETRIDGIGDGLNVLCEPNEFGKSTLFDAVQALFFKPHGSRDKEVMALQPHAGGAPEVTIEVETENGHFIVSKRWLSKPAASVTKGGRLVAQADAAEDWLGGLMGGGRDGGPSGLVWVRQGISELAGGSDKEQKAALNARRDLLSSVTGEVEAMTGGRRMDMAVSRCERELGQYATRGTGRPTGPWRAAMDRVQSLTESRDELAATASALHDALDERKRKRKSLAELEDPDAVAARKSRLDAVSEAHKAAETHAAEVDSAARQVDAARLAVTSAQRQLDALRIALAERTEASREKVGATEATAASRGLSEKTEAALAEAQVELDATKAAEREAEEARRLAQRVQAARDGAERRQDLVDRIEKAETARKSMEEAAALAKQGPDAKSMRQLEKLAIELSTVSAVRKASATHLVMSYSPGRGGTVMLDGQALPDAQPVPVLHGAHLEIDGIGRLDVRPGTSGFDEGSLEVAERALRKALDVHGADDLDAARAAADARESAERRCSEAKAAFDSMAPEGIEPLREAMARIPEIDGQVDGPDLEQVEAALAKAQEVRIEAQGRKDAATERLSNARSELARVESADTAAQDRLLRATTAMEKLGDVTEEKLQEELDRMTTALGAAESLHAEKQKTAPDLAAAEAALKRVRSVDEEARAEIGRLRPQIATLDERISRSSGEAVEERLTDTELALDAAQIELDHIQHEVEVLQKLKAVLDSARTDARERYFAPVASELKPLLHLLWPDAELTWRDDTLLPNALVRDGQEEKIEILSGGTREQVALMVRLAFARMLAKGGRHAPVILDDALVFTDDDRIERMFDALHRQAGDLQIIVFSCRQRAFRELGGRALHFIKLEEAEDAA
jgi:DNA repair exonuclease SbcCD ATPase subunit